MADVAWLFVGGEWTRIENPLRAVTFEPNWWQGLSQDEYRRRLAEQREAHKERLRKGGYSPYSWLDLGVETYLTVDVYAADEQAPDRAPHEFYVHVDREGRGYHIFVSDVPSVLQLLGMLAPIGSWELASVAERRIQEANRDE